MNLTSKIREGEQIAPWRAVKEVKFRIGDSGISGKGLFATDEIKAGEQLFMITGKMMEHKYSPEFAKEGPDWIGYTACKWLAPDSENPILYLNHSCNPNCFINEELGVIAMKPIAPGEELFLDYSTTEIDPYWELDCNCKQNNCRKKIKAFQNLPKTLQFRYLKYIPMRLFKFIPTKG